MKRLTLFLLILSIAAFAQELTLFDCYEKAEANHPLQSELKNRRQIYDLNNKNLSFKWMPQFRSGAQASYMSNVVEFDKIMGSLPIPLPANAFQSVPHEQYKATIEATQTLYDGGAIRAAKLAEKAKWLADERAVNVEFYKIRSQINNVYFTLLMLEKQSEVLRLMQNQVHARRTSLQSGVDNGIVLPENLYALDAELIKLEQKLEGMDVQHRYLFRVLEQIIGEPVSAKNYFELPEIDLPDSVAIARPEIKLFRSQQRVLQASQKVIGSQKRPKILLFGTYGYGNPPGNDFFTDKFDDYYIVGAGVTWTPFDWRTTRRNQLALQAQQNILDAKERNFERMIRISLSNAQAKIETAKIEIKQDPELIALRRRITAAAQSQLESGVISATDYLAELNAEQEARINMEMHKIKMAQAKINYLTIAGQLH